MTLLIENEEEGFLVLTVKGTLLKAELERAQGVGAELIRRFGRIRILAILDHFEGWEPGQNWGDMSFLLAHDEHIAKIGAIGEARWREEILMFLGAGIRVAEVKYFTPGEAPLAREWIRG